jgi:hypothetical protein
MEDVLKTNNLSEKSDGMTFEGSTIGKCFKTLPNISPRGAVIKRIAIRTGFSENTIRNWCSGTTAPSNPEEYLAIVNEEFQKFDPMLKVTGFGFESEVNKTQDSEQ